MKTQANETKSSSKRHLLPAIEQNAVIEQLEGLIERIRAGEIIGVSVVTVDRGGKCDLQTLCYPPATSH